MSVLFATAATVPLIYLIALLVANYYRVPYYDTWSLYHHILKFMNGTMGWGEFLFAQQVDSRPAVPRLLLFLLHCVSRNLSIDVIVNVTSAICAAMATLMILKKTNPDLGWPALWAAGVLFNLNFFSIAQWINWNWHDAVLSFLPNLFFAFGWLANVSSLRPLRRGLLVSLFCALSSFSFVNGLFQWFVLVPITAGLDRRERIRLWIVHLGSALICFALYFTSYRPAKATSSFREGFFHLGRALEYILVWLGSSLSGGSLITGGIWGAILLLTFVGLGYQCLRIWRNDGLKVSWLPWLSMGCYPLVSAPIAALTRSHIGLEQALRSRYCTYSQWLIIGIIGLSITLMRKEWKQALAQRRVRHAIIILLGACFLYFQSRHTVEAARDWRKFAERMRFETQALGLETKQPGQLWTFDHPNRKEVLTTFSLLQQAGFLRDVLHSDKILELIASHKTGLPMDGQLTMAAYLPSREMKCQGWSIGGSPDAGNRVLLVLIRPKGYRVLAVADGPINQGRKDIIRAGRASSTSLAGFKLDFPIPKLEPGRYFVAAFRHSGRNDEYYPVGSPQQVNIDG